MREWKVLRNGLTWTDRFDSYDLAVEYMEELILNGYQGEFAVEEMTRDEIENYRNSR